MKFNTFRSTTHFIGLVIVLVGFVSLVGCGGQVESDFDNLLKTRKSATEELAAKGGKVSEKQYPQGNAYSINLSGVTIDDSVLVAIKNLTPVSELFLSGSTLNDTHAARINELGGYLVILDVSKTEFSDAGLAELKSLPLLMELNIAGSKVSKAAAANYQKSHKESTQVLFKNLKIKS